MFWSLIFRVGIFTKPGQKYTPAKLTWDKQKCQLGKGKSSFNKYMLGFYVKKNQGVQRHKIPTSSRKIEIPARFFLLFTGHFLVTKVLRFPRRWGCVRSCPLHDISSLYVLAQLLRGEVTHPNSEASNMCWKKTTHDLKTHIWFEVLESTFKKWRHSEPLQSSKKGLETYLFGSWAGKTELIRLSCIQDTHETSTLDPFSLSKIQIHGCWLVPNITPKGRPLEIHSDLTNVAKRRKLRQRKSNMRRYWLTLLKDMGTHQNNMNNTSHGNDHKESIGHGFRDSHVFILKIKIQSSFPDISHKT